MKNKKIYKHILLCVLSCFYGGLFAQSSVHSLSLVDVNEENHRQFLVLSKDGQIIDTLAEVPSSNILVDFVFSSPQKVSYILGDETLFYHRFLQLELNEKGIWFPTKTINLGVDMARLSSVESRDSTGFHPVSFELQDGSTVLRKQKDKVEIVDLNAIEAIQKKLWKNDRN